MQFKIFMKVITLSFEENAEEELAEFEKEIHTFIADKPEAKIKWCQSTGCIMTLSMHAEGTPFSHLTAIVHW
jgi:hypothetical protein